MIIKSFGGLILTLFVFTFAAVSNAGTIKIVQVPNGGIDDGQLDLSDTVTNDILLNPDSDESVLTQQMRLVLTAGSIVDHPLGGNVPSDSGIVNFFPSLAFDSFLSAGPEGNLPVFVFSFASDRLGTPLGSPARFEPQEWDTLWVAAFGENTRGLAGYLSARLTLTDDAEGFFLYLAVFGPRQDGFQDLLVQLPVSGGVIGAPEPSACLLVSLAAAIFGCVQLRP